MPKASGRHREKILTPVAVRAKGPGRHADGGGLYLEVDDTGARRWLLRTIVRGRRRDIGLGSASVVSLAKARDDALRMRRIARAGGDPLAERRVRLGVPTFGDFADEYIEAKRPGWKNDKHIAQWETTLRDHAALLRSKPVDEVDTDSVLRVIKPLWAVSPETAARLRGRIEMVLDAAAAKGLRKGDNPARWRGHLKMLLPDREKIKPRQHHRALPYERIPEFVTALQSEKDQAARLLEFTLLTAARTKEAIGADASEFDLAAAAWTVPAARMKAKRLHRVPLCERAVELVKAGAQEGIVFRGRKGVEFSDMAMAQLLKRMGFDGLTTVHGLRSTFATWVQDCTAFPPDLREAALAHKIKDKTEASYARGELFERRRKLMNAWAAYCAGGAKVVKLEAKARA